MKLLSARLLIIYCEAGEKRDMAGPGEGLKGEYSGWLQASQHFNEHSFGFHQVYPEQPLSHRWGCF